MKFMLCHLSGAQNFDVALKSLENLQTYAPTGLSVLPVCFYTGVFELTFITKAYFD
jgi:hypothetical protein